MVDTVNEDTTSYVTLAFVDKAGAPAVPLAVTYRVDCLTNGREVLDWTSFGGAMASSIEITLPPACSAILNPANETERRALQYVASYSVSDQYHGEFQWDVDNLREPVSPILVQGDDYADADGRALKWTGGSGWPTLTGGSVVLELTKDDSTVTQAATIEIATLDNKIVRVEFSAAVTASLAAGRWKYQLIATLASSRIVTLASGTLRVTER